MCYRVATAVKYGVQVRKLCASCEEETSHAGFTNKDNDGLGYCDSNAYGYKAKSSGLVVLPTDDKGVILSGALPVSAWAHVTVGQSLTSISSFPVQVPAIDDSSFLFHLFFIRLQGLVIPLLVRSIQMTSGVSLLMQ